jgi:xanthine dehydrogenase accessory factor
VYEIVLTVEACLRAGTRVDVAWAVTSLGTADKGTADKDTAGKGTALAITPGGGRVGEVVAGALNDQLVDLAYQGTTGRLVDLTVGELDAQLAGLPAGGDVRCLLVPATDLPDELWDRLRRRVPVGLLTRLDGDRVVAVALFAPSAGQDVSDSVVEPDRVTTVFCPVPQLVIVGNGPVAGPLRAAADLLGWRTQIVTDARGATGLIAGLAALDKVVVMGHDDDLAGSALAAALAGEVGYIGALGSRRMQQSRADWLAYRGVTDLDRIHGPAGLDIGAGTPAEIAVSIVAEALAARRLSEDLISRRAG